MRGIYMGLSLMTDKVSVDRHLIEQAIERIESDLVRIEEEWGGMLSLEELYAKNDEDLEIVKKLRASLEKHD